MAYGLKTLTLVKEAGSTNVWASWTLDAAAKDDPVYVKKGGKNTSTVHYYNKKLKNYSYRWWYKVDRDFLPASNSYSELGRSESRVSYSVPSNAIEVRIDIKPVMEPINKKKTKKKYTTANVMKSPTFQYNSKSLPIKAKYDDPDDLTPATITSIDSNIDKSNNLTLTTTISNEEITKKKVTSVNFQVARSANGSTGFSTFSGSTANGKSISYNKASFTLKLTAGFYYVYRAQAVSSTGKVGVWGEWSTRTDKILSSATTPVWVAGSPSLTSSNTVKIDFTCSGYIEEYEVEYATKEMYLNGDSGLSQTKTFREDNPEQGGNRSITVFVDQLESGNTYYFHIRAKSSKFDPTGWSATKSIAIGREPAAPTTYSSKTAAIMGDSVFLYWVHNSQDGSSQTSAKIALYMNQTSTMLDGAPFEIKNPNFEGANDYLKDKTLYHQIDIKSDSLYAGTNYPTRKYSFVDGDVMYWRVCTRGVYGGTNTTNGDGFGPWSAMRQITVFEKPVAHIQCKQGWLWRDLRLQDHTIPISELEVVTIIDRYPYLVEMWATPDTQEAISFNLTITNISGAYETQTAYGEPITIGDGEVIYQQYFDANIEPSTQNYYFDPEWENHMILQLMPNDVDFVDGKTYRFTLDVYMNSGLSATESIEIKAEMANTGEFYPEADITPDPDALVAYISPACYDLDLMPLDPETGMRSPDCEKDDFLTEDVLLSVYRIETDGSFTEIQTNIENTGHVTVTDPHPSLDYARYRVVAVKTTSGEIRTEDYFDDEMGVHSLVLQWDESWKVIPDSSEVYSEDNDLSNADGFRALSSYKGNRIILPWNVDMTENFDPDVAFIEYIGREHPVSYYGTQLGQTASWSTDIVKYNYDSDEYRNFDTNTLFQLRKLARYMGDVYVREPSGTGYWANVRVNWTQTHNEPVIPVSIEIKRVEGKPETSLERTEE